MSTHNKPESMFSRVKTFLKAHKGISRSLTALANLSALQKYKPILQAASAAASHYGYGKRKRRVGARRTKRRR